MGRSQAGMAVVWSTRTPIRNLNPDLVKICASCFLGSVQLNLRHGSMASW